MTFDYKKFAAEIASVGASVGSVLAVIVNAAPAVHIPAPEIAIIITVASVVAAIVAEARKIAKVKLAARRLARAAGHKRTA